MQNRDRVFRSWFRHLDTSSVLFIDGHVDRHIPEDLGRMMLRQQLSPNRLP